jgi:hypothetical protein
MTVRACLAAAVMLFAGCAPAPAPRPVPRADPVTEAWYGEAVAQLADRASEAEGALAAGRPDRAAAAITAAQPLQTRVLAVPRPTPAALAAASDLDCLYARMLLGNQHYGWARLLYQKDQIRWKNQSPQTADTRRRQQRAAAGMAECDRKMQ